MKRSTIRLAGLLMLGALAGALIFGVRLLSVGAAYKAKMLCSEVFVADRNPADVLPDLEVDDLQPLGFVGAVVDRQTRTATASALFGTIERRARFRGEAGCAVVFDDRAEQPSDVSARGHGPAANLDAEPDRRLDGVLDDAFSEPDPTHLRRTRAIVVVHNGRIVGERYAASIGPDTPFLGWSMAKTALNALVGIVVGKGKLSLHSTLPIDAWRAPGDPRGRITLDHLMRMSSGLRFDEAMTNPLNDVVHMLFQSPDMAAFAVNHPLEAEPGTRWKYSSGGSVIVARVLRTLLGDEEYRPFPRTALFDRIGMRGATLETDASGTFVASSFMYATARDWARLGMLYLQDGIWNGQRILPEGWVDYSRTPAPADPQGSYGAHIWLQIPAEYRGTSRVVPPDAFHAVGHEAQFVTIVPSRNVVIVRLGKTRYPAAWDHAAFVNKVLAALNE